MIRAVGVTKQYAAGNGGLKALDSVDFAVGEGEFALIVGRSGSGKSTLLSVLGGLLRPSDGKVLLKDTDIWSLKDSDLARVRGRTFGFVFQFSGLLNSLTAIENVMLPSVFGDKRNGVRERAENLLELVGLALKHDSYPSELSGGEIKRVAIARSLINDPSVLLADEPTSDLDIDTEAEVMALFRRLNETGKTVIMVTHNPDLSSYATTLFRMDRGHVQELGVGEKIGGL